MASEVLPITLPFSPSAVMPLEVLAVTVLGAFILAFWLFPGGLAWALSKQRARSAIPGPSGLPLFGLIQAFTGPMAHRALAHLAKVTNANQIMAFSVGLTRFVVVSQPDTAKELLNSSSFADRPVKESAYELLFHRAMGFAPFGDYWRNLRRISATHMFSPKRIASYGEFRRQIGLKMVNQIDATMTQFGEVAVKKVLHFGSLNNVMMSVFGKSYDFEDDPVAIELESMVSEGYELLGTFNWSDHFPVLGWLDLQGVRRRCQKLVTRVNKFVSGIIDEHREKKIETMTDIDADGDFVDVLLRLEKQNQLSDSDMIAVLWEMIFRGTDTVAILLEWVMARMALHQDVQLKVQAEIDSVVGKTRAVSDSDIAQLRYLQAVVKETLRMHPPGPLLSWARLSIHDVNVGECLVPAGTTAMVNMWAITHDDKVWPEPNHFRPERFMEEDVSVMGSDLRLAPFGSGRRVCPGKALGLATVHLWLAQLLQNHKWSPSMGGVDLTEQLKMSMEMKKPLVCKAERRF